MNLLSLIIPAYNEAENIKNTTDTITKILLKENISFELIFVNDGSKDATMKEIKNVAQHSSNIIGVDLSRNFGKEAAIFAGLQIARGNCAVVIDCDLQHPPELIPKMYYLWQEGYEIVEGIKSDRGKESNLHKIFVKIFYSIMSKLIKMDMQNTSDYKLIDRKVINIMLKLTERNTFFRALSFWTGYKTTYIEYEVKERAFGTSKWSLWELFKYAIVNVTSFSTAPLQLVTGIGVVSLLGSIILAIQTLYRYFTGNAVEGFTTVILLILIVGGCIMISLGIVGHYLARIYEEVKGRPRFIIRDIINYKSDLGNQSN